MNKITYTLLLPMCCFGLQQSLLLLHNCCQQTWAQSGYNYVRPELANAPAVVPTGAGVGGRIVPGAYPTAAGAATPATASAFGGFPGQPATAYTPVQQTSTAFGAPIGTGTGLGVLKRPTASTQTSTRTGSIGGQYGGQYASGNQARIGQSATGTGGGTGVDNDYSDGDYSAIPGVPGVDYPVYAQVPPTNFDCAQQPLPGYYADIEAQCQVFHICALNRTYSFLCPNGTVFSQETLVCVWWNQYDCISAPSLYANNAYIYDYEQRGGSTAAVGPGNVNAAGYQLGGGGSRIQPSNTARTPSNTGAGGGIYGGGTSLRPTVPGQQQSATGGASAFIPSNAPRGFTPTPTVSNTAQYGAVLRPGGVIPTGIVPGGLITDNQMSVRGGGGGSAGQQSSANREYLPPSVAGRRT